jgi:hypothetical protein
MPPFPGPCNRRATVQRIYLLQKRNTAIPKTVQLTHHDSPGTPAHPVAATTATSHLLAAARPAGRHPRDGVARIGWRLGPGHLQRRRRRPGRGPGSRAILAYRG